MNFAGMAWEDKATSVAHVWRSPDGQEWAVTFLLVEIEGRIECVGVDVRSSADDATAAPTPLRALTLRKLPFADVLARARRERAQELAGEAKWWQTYPHPESKFGAKVKADPLTALAKGAWAARQAARLDPPDQKGGRRPKHTMAELEAVAAIYSDACDWTTAPTKEVAMVLEVKVNVAAKLVMKCRRVGLLGPTERRKAGGAKRPPEEGQP